MKCLRCGSCCITYDVIIVNDPNLGIVDDNLIAKHTGDKCPHLKGNKPGEYSCTIHKRKWYKNTPCYAHGQIEQSTNDLCRQGNYILNRPHIIKMLTERKHHEPIIDNL